MRIRPLLFFYVIILWGIYPGLAAKNNYHESPETQVQLLELYSTQSCSSCPPAQKWVSSLKNHPDLYEKFIPIVLHVDYWDYLGWKDPFSKSEFTDRQRKYAKIWSARTVYTPMFVLNGMEWRSRNSGQLTQSKDRVGKIRISEESSELEVQFLSTQDLGVNVRVNYALISNDITTNVRAGENSGRALKQDFIVLDMQSTSLVRTGQKLGHTIYKARVKKISAPKDARNLKQVVWVSQAKNQKPIQALSF